MVKFNTQTIAMMMAIALVMTGFNKAFAVEPLGEDGAKSTIDNPLSSPVEASSVSSNNDVLDWLPVRRPVVEEFTGTWCGWCPRGYVAMESMNRKYPDEFIGIAYHYGDPMQTPYAFPLAVNSFPAANVDRGDLIDPSYAEYYWTAAKETIAPAGIEATAALDGSETSVTVNAKTKFTVDMSNANYGLEFILLSDSLTGIGSDWAQANYYAQYPATGAIGQEEEFSLFFGTDYYVSGLAYNDVFICSSRTSEDGNTLLPNALTANEAIESSYTFDLADAVNTSGESLVQNTANLEVVVMLIDNASGQVVNAYKTKVVKSTTGIRSAKAGESTAETQYYDIHGRKLSSPAKGISIMRKAGGKTVKVMR